MSGSLLTSIEHTFMQFSFRRLLYILLLLGVLHLVSGHVQPQPPDTRPNIVYIMTDDLGYADLSGYGRKEYQTPILDKLAAEGMRFSNAYSAAPVCTPTRVAFMTGRYPARQPVGLREPLRWTEQDKGIGLSPDHPTVSSLLKGNGYETALVGKWHLGFLPEFWPNKHGFDEFFGILAGAVDYIAHKNPRGKNELYENDKLIDRDGYMTDLLAERAVAIISRPRTKPFFLSLMFTAPHWPWQGPGDKPYPDSAFTSGGSPEIFAAMMKSLDNAVGRVLKALEDNGYARNTLVIFTSDNGGEQYSDMGQFSGRKMQLWEGGIRVPAFARWPGVIPANRTTDQAIITMDWTATILAAAQTKPDATYPLDGMNLLPICTGKAPTQSRTFQWRLFQRAKFKALRSGNYKYLQDEKGEYVFDLAKDPGEKQDLRGSHPEILQRLKLMYREWESEMLIPVPLE